jgi:hypothetical protein
LIVEYAYIGDAENEWLRNNRQEYLITQWQSSVIDIPAGFNSGVFNLNFSNHIRELFFVLQDEGTEPYVYSNKLKSIGLSLNGQMILSTDTYNSVYMNVVVPYERYRIAPSRKIYCVCFARDPSESGATGQINFSRIRQKLLEVNLEPSQLKKQLRIFGRSFNVLRIENGLAGLLFNV